MSQLQGAGFTSTLTTYGYYSGYVYTLGAVATTNWTASGSASGSGSTSTQFYWYGGAQAYDTLTAQAGTASYHTTYAYDGNGTLTQVTVGGAKARNVYVYSDLNGQAILRNEFNAGSNAPSEMWYRFAGKELGYVGYIGTDNINYATSLQRRVTANVAGPLKNGQTYGAGVVDFDQAYDAINSYSQGGSGGSYTVRDGDTLAGIAAQLFQRVAR